MSDQESIDDGSDLSQEPEQMVSLEDLRAGDARIAAGILPLAFLPASTPFARQDESVPAKDSPTELPSDDPQILVYQCIVAKFNEIMSEETDENQGSEPDAAAAQRALNWILPWTKPDLPRQVLGGLDGPETLYGLPPAYLTLGNYTEARRWLDAAIETADSIPQPKPEQVKDLDVLLGTLREADQLVLQLQVSASLETDDFVPIEPKTVQADQVDRLPELRAAFEDQLKLEQTSEL